MEKQNNKKNLRKYSLSATEATVKKNIKDAKEKQLQRKSRWAEPAIKYAKNTESVRARETVQKNRRKIT